MSMDETIAEVLRLDAEATQGPWRWSPPKGHSCEAFIGVCSFGDEGGGWDMQTTGNPPEDIDAELIGYYRTAAPALAREVQRLQAEIQPRIERSIAFQDAMEEAEAERDAALAEVQRLQELRQRGCDCSDEDACRFAMERDDAYRRGQEKMRRRASSLFAATDDADCYWRDEDIVEAIEALEIEP